MVNDQLSQSTVGNEEQVLTTTEQWKARMLEKGWRSREARTLGTIT